MHILGPLLYGRSRALCRLLGSFWTRNRSPVNPIFECLAAPVGSRPSGQPSVGVTPTCNSSTFRRLGDSGAELWSACAGPRAGAERRDRLEQHAAQGEKDGELTDGALEIRIVLLEKERPAQHERPRQDQERTERLDVPESASLQAQEVAAEQQIEKRPPEQVDVRRAKEEPRAVRHSLQPGVHPGHVLAGRGKRDQAGDADDEVNDSKRHHFFGRKRIALQTSSSAIWRTPWTPFFSMWRQRISRLRSVSSLPAFGYAIQAIRSSPAASTAGPARDSTSATVLTKAMTASAFAEPVADTPARDTSAGFPTTRSFMPGLRV